MDANYVGVNLDWLIIVDCVPVLRLDTLIFTVQPVLVQLIRVEFPYETYPLVENGK